MIAFALFVIAVVVVATAIVGLAASSDLTRELDEARRALDESDREQEYRIWYESQVRSCWDQPDQQDREDATDE